MKSYIYINHSLRFKISEAPFPHNNGVFVQLQEKMNMLFLTRWISKDSRILTIGTPEFEFLKTPMVLSNYDGSVTEVWKEESFDLKIRLKEIAQEYLDSVGLSAVMVPHEMAC
jgi:hypothetical protein